MSPPLKPNSVNSIAKINNTQVRWILKLAALAIAVSVAVSAADLVEEQRALARAHVARDAALQRSTLLDQQAASARDDETRALARTAAIAARLQAAEAEVTAADARIEVIETLRRRQRARLAEKQQPAVKLIAALELFGKRPPALAFVQPGSLRDVVHLRSVLGAMLPAVHARTADLRAEVLRGVHLRADADQALVALKIGRAQLTAQQNALAADAAAARTRASALASNALVEQDRAVAMGEKARDIRALIVAVESEADVRDELATLPGPVLRPAHVTTAASALPVMVAPPNAPPALNYRLPVVGTVVSGLGEETTPGVRSRGLTISTPANALVVAPSGGRIAYAGGYRGFGQIIIIDHGHGLTSLITNLARLGVRVGDTVIQGSPLGHAGAELPTITIELRRGGTPIDITPLIS